MRSLTQFIFLATLCSTFAQLEQFHSWKIMDYEFPSAEARRKMIVSGQFIPENVMPLDVEVVERDGISKTFVTLPFNVAGVPASLATVVGEAFQVGNLIKPYPDWSWHSRSDCNGMKSVYRVAVDACNRLWLADSGLQNLQPTVNQRVCQPKILAFDTRTDDLVIRYEIPDNVLSPDSRLVDIAIDVRDPGNKCSDTYVYVADSCGNSIIVFDPRRKHSWRVQSNSMFPHPSYGRFHSLGITFDLMEGIAGVAVSPMKDGDRKVFFHAFSSVAESWVPASILRNESLFPVGVNLAADAFQTAENFRPSQSEPLAFDDNGVMYFSSVSENAIFRWNSNQSLASKNVHQVIRDDTLLTFVTGLKIRKNEEGEEFIYVLTNRLPAVLTGQVNFEEVNYRVVRARISDLTQGSSCAVSQCSRASSDDLC